MFGPLLTQPTNLLSILVVASISAAQRLSVPLVTFRACFLSLLLKAFPRFAFLLIASSSCQISSVRSQLDHSVAVRE